MLGRLGDGVEEPSLPGQVSRRRLAITVQIDVEEGSQRGLSGTVPPSPVGGVQK